MSPRLNFIKIATRPFTSSAHSFGRYAISVVLWLPAYILFSENVASVERVTGPSMSPTFCPDQTSNDYILAKHWRAAHNLKRGHVILYRSPLDPERQAIKRIIGLEGDVIRTRHPYPQKIIVVPKGQIWVEGDEAFHSLDSNTFGPIPIALVTAKVTHTLFPLRRVGTVSYDEKLARRGALVAASGRRQATQWFVLHEKSEDKWDVLWICGACLHPRVYNYENWGMCRPRFSKLCLKSSMHQILLRDSWFFFQEPHQYGVMTDEWKSTYRYCLTHHDVFVQL